MKLFRHKVHIKTSMELLADKRIVGIMKRVNSSGTMILEEISVLPAVAFDSTTDEPLLLAGVVEVSGSVDGNRQSWQLLITLQGARSIRKCMNDLLKGKSPDDAGFLGPLSDMNHWSN